MQRVVLSLFDYSGNWSRPYAEAGWRVVQVDLKLGIDVLDINVCWLHRNVGVYADVILAAPPSTDFAGSGAQYWKAKDKDGRTEMSLKLVKKVLWCCQMLVPRVWAMENPVGRLNKLLPQLKQYGPWYWQPWWYGDPYTKKTGLWGVFNRDLPRNEVVPDKVCLQGSWVQRLGGSSERTKTLRSMTPMGFAKAFYAVNH